MLNLTPGTTSKTLLTYAITPMPDPIQVSPQTGDPRTATITIVVNNTGPDTVYLQQILFKFPVGDSKDSTMLATSVGRDTPLMSSPSNQWNFVSNGDGSFTATLKPDPSQHIAIQGESLSFIIGNIQVSKQIGTSSFTVNEFSSADGQHFTNRINNYDLPKFPENFFVGDLVAQPEIVDSGGVTTLRWTGSSAAYTLRYVGHEDGIPVSATRSYEIKNLTRDTTFYLDVAAQVDGETVTKSLHTTVSVNPPPAAQIGYFNANLDLRPWSGKQGESLKITCNWQVARATTVELIDSEGHKIDVTDLSSYQVIVKQTLRPGHIRLHAYPSADPNQPVVATSKDVKQIIADHLISTPTGPFSADPFYVKTYMSGTDQTMYTVAEGISFDTIDQATYWVQISSHLDANLLTKTAFTGTWYVEDGLLKINTGNVPGNVFDNPPNPLGILSFDFCRNDIWREYLVCPNVVELKSIDYRKLKDLPSPWQRNNPIMVRFSLYGLILI